MKDVSVTDKLQQLLYRNIKQAHLLLMILSSLAQCYLLTLAGKGDNMRIAKAWSDAFHPLFSEQFEQAGPAGVEPVAAPKPGAVAMRAVSAENFVYYATGRVGCRSMTVTLDLKARQDMISNAMAMFVPGKKDSLTVEVGAYMRTAFNCVLVAVHHCELHMQS